MNGQCGPSLTQCTRADLTSTLRAACAIMIDSLCLQPNQISTRSLQAVGAIALLLGNIDANTICIIGRWHNDKFCATSTSQRGPTWRGTPGPRLLLDITPSCQWQLFNPQMSEHLQGNGGLLCRYTKGSFGLGVRSDIHLISTTNIPIRSL